MARRKYLQLIENDQTDFVTYSIHEALIDINQSDTPSWIGSKALKIFDNYHEAVEIWSQYEKLSGVLDILSYLEVKDLFDRMDYTTITELDFE